MYISKNNTHLSFIITNYGLRSPTMASSALSLALQTKWSIDQIGSTLLFIETNKNIHGKRRRILDLTMAFGESFPKFFSSWYSNIGKINRWENLFRFGLLRDFYCYIAFL